MSKLVEAQTIKGLGVWIDVGVEVNCICRRKYRGALGNFCSIRKSDGFLRYSMKGDSFALEP